MATRTEKLLALVDKGMAIRPAAKKVGLSASAAYAAADRAAAAKLKAAGICPCCLRKL
jgi:transposase